MSIDKIVVIGLDLSRLAEDGAEEPSGVVTTAISVVANYMQSQLGLTLDETLKLLDLAEEMITKRLKEQS